MQHTFRKDQKVQLVDPKSQVVLFMEYERTPEDEIYTVTSIKIISTACNCGGEGIHDERCAVFNLKRTGHPQSVTIKTSKGVHKMSGVWLKPA